jgi:hypothetical protein
MDLSNLTAAIEYSPSKNRASPKYVASTVTGAAAKIFMAAIMKQKV